MSESERRRAQRLPVALPAAVETPSGPVDGDSQDVSRVGMRVRVTCRGLGFAPTLNLASTAAAVRGVFASTVDCALHHRVLPKSVRRVGGIARIALPLDAPDSVELGVHFDTPLTESDATILGIALPPLRAGQPTPAVVPEPVEAESPPAAPLVGALSCSYRAFLASSSPEAPPSLPCHGDQLSREALRVRMSRDAFSSDDAAAATMQFADRYGTRLTMKLMDVHKHLWTGPVRLCGVDLPPDRPGEMLLTLAFERRLRPAELRRLGLDRAVA